MKKHFKVKITGLFLFIYFFPAIFSFNLSTEMSDVPEKLKGKIKTDRSIRMNFVVDASVKTVFTLWTTVRGAGNSLERMH
jgi:hypothetical protein